MSDAPRSHWGWGYADRFLDRETREGLGAQMALMLGFSGLEARDPVAEGEVELPPPRIPVPDALASFGSNQPGDRLRHTYGRAFPDIVRGFAGRFEHPPDWVAHPTQEEEIVRLLDWAGDARVAVIPFGGGTSVVGGVEAEVGEGFQGVVSLDLRGLDRVLEVDPTSRAARIQAGATGPGLEAQLAEHGLTLRHFPQSFEFSTLGGWLATRSGGHFATGYTHIDDFVESIRALTPAGTWESRRLPASGAGPSPDRLLLGSEGILGVITEAWMRVLPRPRFRSRGSVLFEDYARAVAAVRTVAHSGLQPSLCRLLDQREALLNGVADGSRHVFLLGFESADHPQNALLERALEIARDAGGECPEAPRHRESEPQAGGSGGDDAAGSWRRAFFEAPYLQTHLISLGAVADTFETACTWDRFETLHATVIREVRAALKATCGTGFVSCRFTHVYPDGPAPYFTYLAPAGHGRQLEVWREVKAAAGEAILRCGGTITHHHAVGRTHRPGYEQQRPAPFARVLAAAKGALDPAGVLNPGVLLASTP